MQTKLQGGGEAKGELYLKEAAQAHKTKESAGQEEQGSENAETSDQGALNPSWGFDQRASKTEDLL